MFILMSRSLRRFGRIEVGDSEERLTAETQRAQGQRSEVGPRESAVFVDIAIRRCRRGRRRYKSKRPGFFPGRFVLWRCLKRFRAYFFAAPKFFVISSQLTTFHQASMYSGRRF